MIGVDTNILLRFALADDAGQSSIATKFLVGDDRLDQPAVICPVVLVEFVWTLTRQYRFSKMRVVEILDAFSQSSRVSYSDDALVSRCIEQWRNGDADFADYLIAALNLQAGASTTLTFDRKAAREPGFSLLRS